MSEIRESVVDELADVLLRGESALHRALHAACERHGPTPEELAVVLRRVGPRAGDDVDGPTGTDEDVDALPGGHDVGRGSVLDVNHRLLWTLAQVYDVARRWWLPPPNEDRRTLGDLLKVIPTEEAHRITGRLVWGGLLDPPTSDLVPPTDEGGYR